jgi:hypothetical protein
VKQNRNGWNGLKANLGKGEDLVNPFLSLLDEMTDIKDLISLKEQIKEQVVNQKLTWQERIELYSHIQFINEKIKAIKNE